MVKTGLYTAYLVGLTFYGLNIVRIWRTSVEQKYTCYVLATYLQNISIVRSLKDRVEYILHEEAVYSIWIAILYWLTMLYGW